MSVSAPPTPLGLTVPAPTPALHAGGSRRSRGPAAGRIGRHIAAELQRGRALEDIVGDLQVVELLDDDGRALSAQRGA